MTVQQVWSHGNSGMMEVPNAPRVNTKPEIDKAFYLFAQDGFILTGGRDMVDIGGWGSAVFMSIGFEGRVVVYDRGSKDFDKSGGFWLQYALPTIVTPDARIRKVFVRSAPDNQDKITITRIHVWDGNRARVFADDNVRDPSDYVGTMNRSYEMGLAVSLYVKANRANDDVLKIFGVGAEIDI